MAGRVPAGRKRIMCTQWYAKAYEIACKKFDFCKAFDRTGSNLSADGSLDSDIKLQGLDSFAFSEADADRDVHTGAMPDPALPTDGDVLERALAVAQDSGDEEGDPEELSDNSHCDSDSSSESSDELEGEDFDPEVHSVEIHETMPDGYPHALFGKCVYHRYDDGWYRGTVLRQVSCSSTRSRNSKFAMKFTDSVNEIDHALLPGDYGPTAHWVVVK